MDIAEKVAVITGVASGIGKAVCQQLADKYIKCIAMVDVNEDINDAAESINNASNQNIAIPFKGDTTDTEFRKSCI